MNPLTVNPAIAILDARKQVTEPYCPSRTREPRRNRAIRAARTARHALRAAGH